MTSTPQNTKYHNADEDGWCQNTGCDWNVWNSISKPDCPVNFDGKRAGTVQEQEEMLAKLKGVAPQNTSDGGAESNSPEIDGIKTLRRVLLEFDQSRAEADAQLEQSLANAIAAIHRLYIKRSDVVEAVGTMEDPDRMHASHFQCDIHCMPQLKLWARDDLRQEILTRLGLSGEQEDTQ